MGIEEDRIELTGTEYEKKLYDLKKGFAGPMLMRTPDNQWTYVSMRPPVGTRYIERMPNGECRHWYNSGEDNDRFERV